MYSRLHTSLFYSLAKSIPEILHLLTDKAIEIIMIDLV